MKVGNRPSKRTRHGFTLTADQLMEEAARKEMGARIKELRERSPYRQQHMADKLNVGLRMYQRIEERGTTDWERAQEIADIHDVDPHWIWDGEEKAATPDLMETLNGDSAAILQEIRRDVKGIIRRLDAASAAERARAAGAPPQETPQRRKPSNPGPVEDQSAVGEKPPGE